MYVVCRSGLGVFGGEMGFGVEDGVLNGESRWTCGIDNFCYYNLSCAGINPAF